MTPRYLKAATARVIYMVWNKRLNNNGPLTIANLRRRIEDANGWFIGFLNIYYWRDLSTNIIQNAMRNILIDAGDPNLPDNADNADNKEPDNPPGAENNHRANEADLVVANLDDPGLAPAVSNELLELAR